MTTKQEHENAKVREKKQFVKAYLVIMTFVSIGISIFAELFLNRTGYFADGQIGIAVFALMLMMQFIMLPTWWELWN